MVRIIHSSDLHGNLKPYRKLVQYANDKKADYLLVNGDLFLKSRQTTNIFKPVKSVQAQKTYFTNEVLPILQQFENKVFISMGNADFYANLYELMQVCIGTNVSLLNSQVIRLPNTDLFLLAYSGVPFSPHNLKDFERFDMSEMTDEELRNASILAENSHTYRGVSSFESNEQFHWQLLLNRTDQVNLDDLKKAGQKSTRLLEQTSKYGKGVYPIAFPYQNKSFVHAYSIETHMKQVLTEFEKVQQEQHDRDPEEELTVEELDSVYRRMIWMTHSPPFNTCLDETKHHLHVGSKAIYQLIKERGPLLTLHGHIHESVDMNQGQFQQTIGRTLCCGTGNYPSRSGLALISIEITPTTDTNDCEDCGENENDPHQTRPTTSNYIVQAERFIV